jgi:hypothetical protein
VDHPVDVVGYRTAIDLKHLYRVDVLLLSRSLAVEGLPLLDAFSQVGHEPYLGREACLLIALQIMVERITS